MAGPRVRVCVCGGGAVAGPSVRVCVWGVGGGGGLWQSPVRQPRDGSSFCCHIGIMVFTTIRQNGGGRGTSEALLRDSPIQRPITRPDHCTQS